MRVGRLSRNGESAPFLITDSGTALDWQLLDEDGVPDKVRRLVRLALQSGRSAEFLQALDPLEEYLASAPDFIVDSKRITPINLAEHAHFLPPVPPQSFICIGLNYRDHAQESKMEIPSRPLLFAKTANAISGHGHPVRIPCGSVQLDYEAELAVVIGKTCRNVSAQNALDYVAGYTCANDLSARDFQFADGQWYRGKSCDGFGPIGPWLVTKSSIPNPGALAIRCRVNGNTMQDSTTANLIFGVPELVEFVSSFITLQPGDVIATGTPPGVGFARKPPVYLQSADVVEVEIEKIGVLRNVIDHQKGTCE